MDEVLEWREEVALMCPAAEGKNGELPTDLVAACPIDEDEPDLSTLLQSLTLSAFMRHAQRTSLHTGEISAKEALFSPLISPEFLEGQPNSPSWCRSSKSHFGELLQQICDSLGDSAGHTIIPLLIPTFSAPNQTLDLDAVKELPNYGKVFSEINMEGMPSQATLRESMKEHVERIAKQLSEGRGRVLSALHVHVNMKQDHAQDIVDYLRFQLEWCAGELFGLLHEKPGLLTQSALHVLAVVAHGVRGDDGSRSIRPFLLAGPVTERTDASPDVKMFQWTGIAVDHFSHLLPWGMRPEELLNGTIKEIFGLQDESPDRFRRILADALPHVVPRFGSEPHHADSFVIIQSLMREINSKPELVSGIRSVLAEQLSLEEADWRMDVAKNIELLRRTGPFQLALLSHLRRDDKIQPVIKAVWQHSLHTSCPNKIAPEEDAIQSVHWRPVAESLLHHVLSSAIHQAEWEPMLSQRHPGEMRTLLMPGSAAAMQILLPQLQSKEGLRDRNFIEVLMDQAVQLAAVLPRCLPATLCNALNAVGQSLSSGKAGDVIGLFGDDVITEMTARACASVQEWPGSATFESVRLHLHVIVRALMRNMARQQADDAGNPIDQQESKRDEYPHMLKALLPAVAAVLLLPLSQQVAALQTQFPTLHTWADCLEALLNPFPLAGTWRTFFERGMQAAFQLHGLDLEDSLCSSADAGEDLQDSLQLLQQLSVAIEDFVITVGCTDASIVRVAAISHMLSSSKGIAPDKAMSILSFMRNKSNVHLLEAVAGLIEVQDIDTAIPLVGVSYALQLLGEESKKDPAALKACLTLMNQAIQRSDNDFQKLHPLKTYLQQISIYLMEHLMSRVGVSTINSWPEAEEIGERVLSESFYALMEEQEAGLTTSATVMHLLEDVLPSTAQGCGWDTPLVACLAAALSTTSQLSLVIANLVKHSLKKKLGNPSKRALQMLEDAFKKTLSILQRRDPQKSQVFVAFVLARELVLHSVDVVETYLETDNEELQQRLEKVLTCIVEALEMQFAGSTRVDADTAMLLCTYEGRDLRVEQLPTAFASLYVVAATRRREAPLPTNTAIKHLLEVVAFIAGGGDSGLHCFLESCRDEMVTLSNALGLSLLLPDQSKVADIKTVVSCLHDLGSEEQSCSQQAAKQFEGLCHEKRDNFQALLQSMRAVGEVACMQCSAEDEETLDLAGRIARELPSVLGPAGVLLRLKADDETPWNIDFLNMDAEKAWQASIFAHLICFLGAAHVSINRRQEDLPPAIKPFVAFNSIDEPTLNSTFWPGVPNDWWQSLRYSGLHKHLLPVTGNIVWGQCQCGYRYCYAECGAPVSAAKCPSPEGEGRCTLMNGGQNHTFAPHQQLIAVVVTAHPHGTGWPPVYSSMSQGFPAAFRPPPPSPGLFALTEADLHISVTEKERAVVSHSLMSETVRQDWNQPLGKPPDPKSGLHPIAFRVLHLLIHASALIGIEMEWVQERDNIVQLLQGHLRQVARMNPVRNANDTVWYFMANVEADLDALAKLLNGTLEVATLFMHAVLHRLGSLQPHEQPSGQTLTSHNARVAYETWFHNTIIQPILGEKGASGDFPLPGVHALRREAGQATDPNLLLKADFLARRGLQTGAWANMKEDVRAALLPHVLRPLVSASIGDTFEELVAASMGGNRFVILRLLMAGVEEESASWRILPDLARAASLAWILPFMQLVRDKEGGKITMREARTTTIRKWLESRAGHEQHHAWITFRNFEAAWNAALASDQLRDGCGVIRLPRITLESPLAMACPIANPEKPQHGDIEVGNLDKPEHIASLGLHHLAVSHNKLIAQVNAYLVASNAIAAHVRARLHPSAGLCQSSGQCQPAAETCHDQSVRLIQKASATDLFVFPSQLEDACAVEDDVHPHGPRTFRLDYKIGTFCQDFFQVPWSADPPARGEHDFEAMESDLAWRLIVGRRPLQICSDLGSRLVQQVSLSEALSVQKAEDLEISFFRDTSHALEVSKITGDLIALLLGVNVAHAFRSDMTLLEFVEVFTLVDKADLPDVATVPLNALVALHLLSKDMLAMTRGVSIKTRDTGTEYTKSLDLPPQFKDGLDKLKEECPQVLAVVCRLVARTVYLASELPLDHDHRHDKEKFQKAPPLCMLVKQMDILDELAEVGEGKEEQAEELLEMPVPLDLEYWNDWNEGHAIAAVKIYRSLWSEIREPYLAPAKPVLAASNDPAVASGMAKGLATSGWLQPKDQDESEEDGDWEVIDPIDPTSPVKTRPVKAGRGNKSSAERQRQDQAGATFVGKVHYSGSWADELAAIMADKTAESYSVRTKGGQGSSIPFVAGGQPGELVSTPMSEDFPLIVIPKKAEARQILTILNGHKGLKVWMGLDFMRDVLEKFINQRAGRTIEKEDAKQVALAWDDVEMMGEALQPLLMPLGQDVDVTEERGRFVTEFHQHFEQQQNSMPRPIKDHVQPSQLQTCILEAKGWTLRKSPGDGHCQFHSVGFAVGEGHETVRSHALAWITQHREEYKMKMVVERNGTPASFTDTVEDDELESALDKYIARMSEGAWGDNITLHALAHHYQREIRVLTDNVKNAWVQIEPGFGNPIYVAFYAEFHYDSVITETPTL
ncbi:OVARIAN TUMOR DOMAIN-containing deubiquitinating enzyme 10 (OTU domain-containing protein 10) (Deubiquitinating enzyme OTU10) [Durusdinium trenchii]|uniref:OVARIAN TUMOR DOMAIN-containing deubiquitinating enzyme 10 (OTU domain-containing protein 10) (Deubiquitinating enzyme OTU10) n=1 Tax=Durusdinium trenchii TaxID=1381693 RepID=A0ABP0LDP5_9DINO